MATPNDLAIANALSRLAKAEEKLVELFDQHNKTFAAQYERFVKAEEKRQELDEERTQLEHLRYEREAHWREDAEKTNERRFREQAERDLIHRAEDREFQRERDRMAHDAFWGGKQR